MSTQALTVTGDILFLSDHEDEVKLVRAAAGGGTLHVVGECGDVLPFLRREGVHLQSPRPGLILLDLDLSRDDDCDTLVQIKNDRDLRRIPLVVIADDRGPGAVLQAYDLQANAYVVKPRDPATFIETICGVFDFWLKLARLPDQVE